MTKAKSELKGISLEQVLEHVGIELFSHPIETIVKDLAEGNLERYNKLTDDEIKLRKEYLTTVPKPEGALNIAKTYVENLELVNHFTLEFGDALFDGIYTCLDPDSHRNNVPVQYEIPLTISDGTIQMETRIWVNKSGSNWEAQSTIKNIETIKAKLEKMKHGYILIEVPDVEIAQKLAEEIFEREEASNVIVWNNDYMCSLNANLAMASIHSYQTEMPDIIMCKTKPKEEKIRKLMANEHLTIEQEEAQEWVDNNRKELEEKYKGRVIVVSGSSVIGEGETMEKAMKDSEGKGPGVIFNFTGENMM